jgi:hypothetical protein
MPKVTVSLTPGNDAKLRELILYICETSEGDESFGSVKLNKLLFYSDFLAYQKFGKAITGHEYQKLEQGPAPRAMLPMMNDMTGKDELRVREGDYFGKRQKKPLALREPQLDKFNGNEIALVDRLIKRFWGMSGTAISELSHEFVGWQIVEMGETIPYSLALLDTRPLTEQEKQWALELEPRAKELLAQNAH